MLYLVYTLHKVASPNVTLILHYWSSLLVALTFYVYALQKVQGLALWQTVHSHHKILKLLPSIRIPTADEISKNIAAFLGPPPSHTSNGFIPGNVLMTDSAALNTTCCYCPTCDSIIGLCREHSHRTNWWKQFMLCLHLMMIQPKSVLDQMELCLLLHLMNMQITTLQSPNIPTIL